MARNILPKVSVAAKAKAANRKFQHSPVMFPNAKRKSFRLKLPLNWKAREMKSTLKIASAIVD